MHLSKFYLNMVNRRQDYLPYLFYKDVSDFPGLFVEKYFFNSSGIFSSKFNLHLYYTKFAVFLQ